MPAPTRRSRTTCRASHDGPSASESPSQREDKDQTSNSCCGSPCLPPFRAAMIGELTARARLLQTELTEKAAKIDAFQTRCAAIRRELAELDAKVREHAWDGQPLV